MGGAFSRGMPAQKGAVDSRRSRPAERRDQDRARGVDEMNRDETRRRGALGPFADPADMAGIAQRDRGEARRLRFFNADVDGHRRHRLAKAEPTVEDADHGRVDDTFDRLIGHEVAAVDPVDVTRDADDAVAVVAGEIGIDQRGRDPLRFVGLTADASENLGAEAG